MRLSVDVTPEQHQRLKAVAALQGKSLKDYVLDRVLPWTTQEKQALSELETYNGMSGHSNRGHPISTETRPSSLTFARSTPALVSIVA